MGYITFSKRVRVFESQHVKRSDEVGKKIFCFSYWTQIEPYFGVEVNKVSKFVGVLLEGKKLSRFCSGDR